MTTMRRAAILKLATAAYEMNLDVADGFLIQDDEGRWRIGNTDLESWLTSHNGEELVLILGSLVDDRPIETRTCGTCGRDFTDIECPYCRESRIRLRGHP